MTKQFTFKDNEFVRYRYSLSDEPTLRGIISPNGDFIEDDYRYNSKSRMGSDGVLHKHNKPFFRPCGDLNIARIKDLIDALETDESD